MVLGDAGWWSSQCAGGPAFGWEQGEFSSFATGSLEEQRRNVCRGFLQNDGVCRASLIYLSVVYLPL